METKTHSGTVSTRLDQPIQKVLPKRNQQMWISTSEVGDCELVVGVADKDVQVPRRALTPFGDGPKYRRAADPIPDQELIVPDGGERPNSLFRGVPRLCQFAKVCVRDGAATLKSVNQPPFLAPSITGSKLGEFDWRRPDVSG